MIYYERKVNESLTRTLTLNENQEQTRKLAAGYQNTVLRLQIELMWFEEIFEEYKKYWSIKVKSLDLF